MSPETLFDIAELLRDLRQRLRYWNDLYREPVGTAEKVIRSNCRSAIAACITRVEEELELYEERGTKGEDSPGTGTSRVLTREVSGE